VPEYENWFDPKWKAKRKKRWIQPRPSNLDWPPLRSLMLAAEREPYFLAK
jgi:hypothetical protein